MQFTIFLIIPPGLEDLGLKELQLKCPVERFEVTKGGIEVFEVNLDWIVNAHSLLKIPTRMLLRLTDFKVKDFPKLYSKFLTLNWNSFLSHPHPVFEISCSKSRLFHTGKIESTIKDALTLALKKQALREDWKKFHYSPQTLYVRIQEDHLTLSLDLTGDPLYKRGLQPIKGEAPLRENLAAALIFDLFKDEKNLVNLIDPMCGSGTFLFEAVYFHEPLHLRKFQFEEYPLFRGKSFKLPKSTESLPLIKAKGHDVNSGLLSKILSHPKIELSPKDSLQSPLQIEKSDFMICNPPYGDRIQIEGKKGKFLNNCLNKFLTQDSPKKMGWLIPRDFNDSVKIPKNYEVLSKREFRNGGLAVSFWIFQRKD